MTVAKIALVLVCALVASVLGGVLASLGIARKDLGAGLAATMGAFFGPVGGFFGALLGIGALAAWLALRH